MCYQTSWLYLKLLRPPENALIKCFNHSTGMFQRHKPIHRFQNRTHFLSLSPLYSVSKWIALSSTWLTYLEIIFDFFPLSSTTFFKTCNFSYFSLLHSLWHSLSISDIVIKANSLSLSTSTLDLASFLICLPRAIFIFQKSHLFMSLCCLKSFLHPHWL